MAKICSFICLCGTVVVISTYVIFYSPQKFGHQILKSSLRHQQDFLQKTDGFFTLKEIDFRKRIFALKHITNGTHILKKITNRTHSYDVAIVSMSPWWYSHSTLPREIHCNGANTSIKIRKATEDSIDQADILIFANHPLSVPLNWTKLQLMRHERQLWVHTTEESPFHSLSNCPPMGLDIVFNISSTYHPKADISVPYGRFIPFRKKSKTNIVSSFYKKTKLIVWVSSHCYTAMWRRSDFAHDLAKYLPLDIYGECGSLNCPKNRYLKCRKLFSLYKFYLAMENSCCGGYITEKFWDPLVLLGAIPVVVGAPKGDYASLAPHNSYIHADNFGSMRELANYILKVANGKALYDSYFQWKSFGTAKKSPVESKMAFSNQGVCRLIEYERSASDVSLPKSSFDPYGPFWFGGCNECGEQEWLKNYTNFIKISDMKKRHQSER